MSRCDENVCGLNSIKVLSIWWYAYYIKTYTNTHCGYKDWNVAKFLGMKMLLLIYADSSRRRNARDTEVSYLEKLTLATWEGESATWYFNRNATAHKGQGTYGPKQDQIMFFWLVGCGSSTSCFETCLSVDRQVLLDVLARGTFPCMGSNRLARSSSTSSYLSVFWVRWWI